MKREKFWIVLLITAWILFIGTGRNIAGSIFLSVAGIYTMIESIREWGKK